MTSELDTSLKGYRTIMYIYQEYTIGLICLCFCFPSYKVRMLAPQLLDIFVTQNKTQL